jgi:hypothetical protein
MSSCFERLNNYLRINFVGRPFELNKLVYDNNSILENEEEAGKIIKAYRIHKGWQYMGIFMTFTSIYAFSSISKKRNYNRPKQAFSIACAFLFFAGFYIYSHFTYWHIIRDIVISTRKREKKYAHLQKDEIDDFRIKFNANKDLHLLIQHNIGVFKFIISIFLV